MLRGSPEEQEVPTCPGWRTDDLLRHLAEAQWFWGTVVREQVSDPETLEHLQRPADRAGCWLCGRPTVGAVDRSGDGRVLARFQAMLDTGIT